MKKDFSIAGVYVNYNYQFWGQLKVDGEEPQKIVKKAAVTIYNWAKNKVPDLKMDEKIRSGSRHKHSQRVDIIYNYIECYFCMLLEHPDVEVAGRTWTIEAEITNIDDKIMLGVKVMYTTPKRVSLCAPNYGAPRFVNQIADKMDIVDVAPLNTYHRVESIDEINFLYELVINTERNYPVVVLSDDSLGQYKGYLLDGKRFKKRIGLIAHVYVIGPEMLHEWELKVSSNWSIMPGCVRTYNRGFNFDDEVRRHPYTSINKILAASITDEYDVEQIAGKAYEILLANMIVKSTLRTRIDWKQLGFKFYFIANKERENLNLTIEKQQIETFDRQIEERDKKIEELENELITAWDDIEQQNSVIEKNKTVIYNQNNRIDELTTLLNKKGRKDNIDLPSSYSMMEEWIEKYYSGRIVLLGRAKRGIKNAEFEDVKLVYKSLQILAESYYQMKKGRITQDECNKKCQDIKIEITGAIADSRAGEFGDTYYVDYKNRRTKLDMHVKNSNSRDPKKCMRIYFFWDDEDEVIVIGDMPQHLQIRTS